MKLTAKSFEGFYKYKSIFDPETKKWVPKIDENTYNIVHNIRCAEVVFDVKPDTKLPANVIEVDCPEYYFLFENEGYMLTYIILPLDHTPEMKAAFIQCLTTLRVITACIWIENGWIVSDEDDYNEFRLYTESRPGQRRPEIPDLLKIKTND